MCKENNEGKITLCLEAVLNVIFPPEGCLEAAVGKSFSACRLFKICSAWRLFWTLLFYLEAVLNNIFPPGGCYESYFYTCKLF